MVYFVTFSLIGTNVNGTKWETGKSRTALPRGSCKGSDQNGAPGPRYALAWTRGIRYVPPSEIEKWKIKHFWNSNRAIWWMPFGSGNILPESCFKIKYWLHYHVSSSSHLSCFDAFSRTFIIFGHKNMECLGGVPSQKLKNAIFKLNLGNLVRTFCQNLLKKHSSFSIKYWLFLCLFLPPFLFWCLC